MKSVAAAKRVRRATHDTEKYFSPGRPDIREGQWGLCWVGTVRHQLPDTQKAEEGQGEGRPVKQLVSWVIQLMEFGVVHCPMLGQDTNADATAASR